MTKNTYTVEQVNAYIRNMFAQDFLLRNISVTGEVSNCKYHSSGHIYFTLKDKKGALNAIMFAGNRKGLLFPMKDGDQVVVTGSVEVYERDGKYQLYANKIAAAGIGELYQKYQALKQELEDMGMFAMEYKKPIPKYIHTLGIVTASTGAAIRDIQNISYRRNPYVQLILYPAMVQGEDAAESIVRGIRALNDYGVDVIIAGRGGGSIEDLWAFNEEIVARAIFESEVPVISAVGHETDFTIADFVSDLRAPTPSAAAELAVFDLQDEREKIQYYGQRLFQLLVYKIECCQHQYMHLHNRITASGPKNQLNQRRQQTLYYEDKLETLFQQRILEEKHRLQLLAGQLEVLSPGRKLSQGFAYVADDKQRKVTAAKNLQVGSTVSIYFQDGKATARIENLE